MPLFLLEAAISENNQEQGIKANRFYEEDVRKTLLKNGPCRARQ
jgi:hypothetical protein